MEQQEYLDTYQQQLTEQLLRLCTQKGALDRQLLETPDLEERWRDIAPAYMADAVKEIAQYPDAALGWMMYVGMAVAHFWDEDWARHSRRACLYAAVRDPRGFDCLDEYVREEVLGFPPSSAHYAATEDLVRQCARTALDKIRHEGIEPQSPMAFHVYVRSIHALFRIGVAVELKRLGYKFEPMV